MATAIAAIPISAASFGSSVGSWGDVGERSREQLPSERADEQRCEEQAAAKAEAERDCRCGNFHQEHGQDERSAGLGAKIHVERAVAGG